MPSRDITTDTEAAYQQPRVCDVFFFYADFPDGIVRLWNGYGPITFAGDTWQGVGDLGGIDGIAESSEIRANPLVVSLNGLKPEIVALALTDGYQGREVRFYQGALDTTTRALIADPYLRWSGTMNYMTIDRERGAIAITCESDLIDLNRASGLKYTSEDQKTLYPGDTFFDLIPLGEISFGLKDATASASSSPESPNPAVIRKLR